MSSKIRPLSVRWHRWRRRKYQALLHEGMETDLAWDLATKEARGRQRLAATVGLVAAEAASLVWADVGGKLRCYLSGSFEGLSETAIDRIEARPEFGILASL